MSAELISAVFPSRLPMAVLADGTERCPALPGARTVTRLAWLVSRRAAGASDSVPRQAARLSRSSRPPT